MRTLHQFLGLKILKFFDADPDPRYGILSTLDPGSGLKKSDPGSGINIPDPNHFVHPSMEEDGSVVSIILFALLATSTLINGSPQHCSVRSLWVVFIGRDPVGKLMS